MTTPNPTPHNLPPVLPAMTQEPLDWGLSFGKLMSAPFPRSYAILPNFLFEGHISVFGGGFGLGKTYFWLQLTVHAAIGRDLWGMAFRRRYTVLYIDTENGGAEIRKRVETYISSLNLSDEEEKWLDENWTYLDYRNPGPLEFLNLSKQSGFDALSAFLQSKPTELVILDCFGKLFSAKETDEDAIKTFCARAQKLVADHDSLQRGGLVFLHHCSKPTEYSAKLDIVENISEYLTRLRGSGRFLDLVQGRYAMGETKAGDDTYMAVNGIVRSMAVSAILLQRRNDGFFALHENTTFVQKKVFGKAKRQLQLFRAAKSTFGYRVFTFTEIERLKDATPQLVTDCLRKAVGAKLINQVDSGYQFPETP